MSGNTSTNSGIYAVLSEWRDAKKGETCGSGNIFKNNKYGNGYGGKSIKPIRWGGKGGGNAGKLTWNNCKKPSITNKGGNSRL
ncbi:hypothetical protein [Streptomyces adelaidensis]|uniref:hypothetical protein n=1 Tax=Streptomyces adelaidensis TaxID=2796465 RepID=UPI001903CBB1|nr:hypothetical protein [Streptomyces adelaidensis]